MAKEAAAAASLVAIDDPEDMVAAIRGELVPEIEDPEQVALAIMERILAGETAEEVLGGLKAVHAEDVLSRPFTLHGLRLMRSRFETGPGVFAVLDCEFGDDGSREAVTCSGRSVLAQSVQLYRLGALPRSVKIVKAEQPTAAGFYPLWLESA